MKKSIEISVHLLFWILFTATVFILSKIYLEANPDSPFSRHLLYVIFLEVFMGVIFFYATYFCMPWALKKQSTDISCRNSSFTIAFLCISGNEIWFTSDNEFNYSSCFFDFSCYNFQVIF